MTILDLGCGGRKYTGAIGADLHPLLGVNVVCDLTRFPYPFATDSVDEVHLNHVIEHMDDPVRVLGEAWRITKPGGKVYVRVPHYSGRYAWKDPTHKRSFTSESFGYFGENSYSYYTTARFAVSSVRLKYFLEPPSRRLYRWWGALVQALLNRHPTFFERFVAYLVGGIDEIHAVLETQKSEGQKPCTEATL
jgi:SAM-dependent methyltransferase